MNGATEEKADLHPIVRGAMTEDRDQSGSASDEESTTRSRAGARSEGPRSRNVFERLPFDPWRLVEAVRRRWWWLVLGGGGLALLCLRFGLANSQTVFTATVQLIRNEGPNAFQTSEFGEAFRARPFSEPAFRGLLRSQELLHRVSLKAQPPVSVKALSDRLRLSPDRNVDFISLTLAGTDPQATVELANLFAREAGRFTQEMQAGEAREIVNYLQGRLQENEQSVAAAEEQLKTLSRELQQAEPAGNELREELRAARRELIGLLGQFTDAHPRVQEQRDKIEAIERQLGESVPGLASDAEANGDAARTNATTSASIVGLAPGKAADDLEASLKRAQGRRDELEKARALLQSRQREARSFAADPPGYYRLLAPANVEDAARHGGRLKVAILTLFGGFFGFTVALCAALLAEITDRRIKTTGDLRRVTGLPVLATLGDLDRMSPAQQTDWAFRSWTKLQDKLNHSPNQGIVCGFTSSAPGEGRSTWIRLLGQAASQRGVRVLSIATRPSPANGHGAPEKVVTATPDFRDVSPQAFAADEISLAMIEARNAALTRSILSHPEQIAAQLGAPDAPPVVHIPLPGWVWDYERRKQWHAALEQWRNIENAVILVELPPASVPEAVLLAEHVPQLIWLSGGKADRAQTRRELETLRHARCNLVGAVLNRETVAAFRNGLVQWMAGVAVLFALGASATRAAEPVTDPPGRVQPAGKDETRLADAKPSFSVASSHRRAPWQERLTLGPGDVLNFSLFGRPELARNTVSIGPDGRVSYLQAQDVLAAGLTIDELRLAMDETLAAYYRAPRTIITPVAFNSKKYFLLGTVVQKGVYSLDRPTTIIEAIARARGLETGLQRRNLIEIADLQRTFLVRRGQRMPVDFEKLFLRGDLSQNVALEPDDYLYFPPVDMTEVYVVGEVRAPGAVSYSPNTSALGAIASQGGFTDRAWKRKILIVRGSLDRPQTFAVDANDVLSARTMDFKLEPRDIVYVHYRPWIRAEELLDLAATAFVQAAVITWTGGNIGPLIRNPIIK